MRFKKFVLDANIWISYLISNQEHKLVKIIYDNGLVIYNCDELLIEIKRVLNYVHLKKFKINIKQAISFVEMLSINFKLDYPLKNYIPDDNDDNYIVALALQTNSGFITSGDNHILSRKAYLEKKYKKLAIITKAEFELMFK